MVYPVNTVQKPVEALLRAKAWKATLFLAPNFIVRASRRTYGKKLLNRGNIEVLVTMGKPNYAEREFIKSCKKSGEKFPVKKIQLKFPPKK